jgi:hypothetical protein
MQMVSITTKTPQDAKFVGHIGNQDEAKRL